MLMTVLAHGPLVAVPLCYAHGAIRKLLYLGRTVVSLVLSVALLLDRREVPPDFCCPDDGVALLVFRRPLDPYSLGTLDECSGEHVCHPPDIGDGRVLLHHLDHPDQVGNRRGDVLRYGLELRCVGGHEGRLVEGVSLPVVDLCRGHPVFLPRGDGI